MFLIFFVLINLLIFLALGYLWFGGVLLGLILFFINRKSNKLYRELGLKPKMIKQALKGEKVDYEKPKIKPSEKKIDEPKASERKIEKPKVEYEYECSECKAEVKEEDEVCLNCGAKL